MSTDEMTRRAVEGLGVPAESPFVIMNGLKLHTVVAGPEDGPLAVLLHGYPERRCSWAQSTNAVCADRPSAAVLTPEQVSGWVTMKQEADLRRPGWFAAAKM